MTTDPIKPHTNDSEGLPAKISLGVKVLGFIEIGIGILLIGTGIFGLFFSTNITMPLVSMIFLGGMGIVGFILPGSSLLETHNRTKWSTQILPVILAAFLLFDIFM